MSDKQIVDKLFESAGTEVLSEETKEQIKHMIDAKVEARLAEATKQLKEKENNLKKWLEEQNRQLREKEFALEEVAESFAKQCADEMKEKEAIMFESLKEFKQQAEIIIAESSQEFKNNILETTLQECAEYKTAIEEETIKETITHISEYKKLQEAALAKEVDTAKATIVDRMSKYLDTKVQEAIPAKVMEAAVEAAAYRPLVENMIKTFAQGYVKFDSTGYTAIKEAKAEASRLSESVNAKTKDIVRLTSKVKELERSQKILSLCEGLTAKQRTQAKVLLEKVETENLDEAFNKLKKNLIEESVRVQPQVQKNTESAKKQLEKLQESVVNKDTQVVSDVSSEIDEWAKSVNRNFEK